MLIIKPGKALISSAKTELTPSIEVANECVL